MRRSTQACSQFQNFIDTVRSHKVMKNPARAARRSTSVDELCAYLWDQRVLSRGGLRNFDGATERFVGDSQAGRRPSVVLTARPSRCLDKT